jgi:hypothetical protein
MAATIYFHGLCVISAPDSKIGVPAKAYFPICQNHPHTAVLTVRSSSLIIEKGVTPLPDGLGVDYEGKQVLFFRLNRHRLELCPDRKSPSEGSTWNATKALNLKRSGDDVICSESSIGAASRVTLPGGGFNGEGAEEPFDLVDSSDADIQTGPFFGTFKWASNDSPTQWNFLYDDGSEFLTFKDGAVFSIANTAPAYGSNAAHHFDAVYEILRTSSGTTVAHQYALRKRVGGATADEGVNCVPPGGTS